MEQTLNQLKSRVTFLEACLFAARQQPMIPVVPFPPRPFQHVVAPTQRIVQIPNLIPIPNVGGQTTGAVVQQQSTDEGDAVVQRPETDDQDAAEVIDVEDITQ